MDPLKKLLNTLGRSARTMPLTDEEVDLVIREADEGQVYIAAITSSTTKEQQERLEARWKELRSGSRRIATDPTEEKK